MSSPEAYNIGISHNRTVVQYNILPIEQTMLRKKSFQWWIFFGSNKSQSGTESKSSEQAKYKKESQQKYERKWKRSFQKKWIEEFDGMDITKYCPGQNKHTTLMQNTKWSM